MEKFVLILTLALSCSAFVFPQKQPEIKFDPCVYDFGTVFKDDPVVTCEFKFTNTGGSKLAIYDVTLGCGCLSCSCPVKVLQPGASADLKVTFDGRGQHLGEFRKEVYVTTNTESQYYRLFVKGTLVDARPDKRL